MEMSCPGRREQNLDSVVVRCPECALPVEIFSDEQKVRCRCGHVILREAVPSCISWCPAAQRCLGEVIDVGEVRRRIEAMHKRVDTDDYVKKVRKQIDESHRKEKDAGPPQGPEAGQP